MKPSVTKNEIGVEKEIKKAHIWLVLSGILVILSFYLAYSIYGIVTDFAATDENGSREIKSLSVDLSRSGEEASGEGGGDDDLVRRPLDGVFVEIGKEAGRAVAVMIDNSIFARPPSSIARAGLVYEAEVEGGSTRLMAVFPAGIDLEEIGPVRSARPYFVDWSKEFAAAYVHCGGSPEALVKLAREAVTDINEFYQGKYFWRDEMRAAPHNVYTSTRSLEKYFEKNNIGAAEFASWLFKEDAAPESRPEENKIVINFRLSDYVVTWKYDRLSNSYIRYAGKRAHIDRNGDGITAKNVIIEYLDAKVIDEELRLKIDVLGEGKAVICLDGACRDGLWKKGALSERTRFYDESGEETEFNAGPAWIEVVRPEYAVDIG